jgi:hypothetical protein
MYIVDPEIFRFCGIQLLRFLSTKTANEPSPDPIHSNPSCFENIHFNIILFSMHSLALVDYSIDVQVQLFWVVMECSVVEGYHCFVGPCCLPEDGGSMDLRNVGILPQHYTASQPRRLRLEISPL